MLPQHPELRIYLDMKLSEPYNHYCINCKKRQSTHVTLWLGAFICKNCAATLIQHCGGNRHCYIKDVFNEQWDDYQLKSLAHGGNENLFAILKEYDLVTTNLIACYWHPALVWYRKQLLAKMDRRLFAEPKPEKDWTETFTNVQDKFSASLSNTFEDAANTDW